MTHLGGAGVSYSVLGLLLAPDRELSFAAYLMVLFQVIADLFSIVDLVALVGLFNSFRMMRLPESAASDTLRETTLG
jgi:hypothetical protein